MEPSKKNRPDPAPDNQDVRLLGTVPLFFGLDDEELAELESYFIRRRVFRNAIIMSEGDPGDTMYIVESGRVRVFLNDDEGKEVVLAVEGAGSVLGELSLLDGNARSASAMTLETTTFLVVSREQMLEFLEANPRAALGIISHLSGLVRRLTENVRSLALKTVYTRVVEKLYELAVDDGAGTLTINEKLTHQDLADRIGASREMTSRVMRDLNKGGYINNERNQIQIKRTPPTGW